MPYEQQYTTLASQVEPLLNPGHSAPTDERGELDLLRHKWVDTVGDWEAAQKDADVRSTHPVSSLRYGARKS